MMWGGQLWRQPPYRRLLEPLRTTALIAMLAGAAGSIALLLRAGQRNNSRLLMVLMTIWVLSPFVALLCASAVSKRWRVSTRTTLHSLMLVVAPGSLVIYGLDAVKPLNEKAAFVFVVVPLVSLLLSLVVLAAAFMSARLSHRG